MFVLRALLLGGLLSAGLAGSGHAGVISTVLSPFTGDWASVQVTFDDMSVAGKIEVTVEVIPSPNIGDIWGVWFHVSDESLLPDLMISGEDVTDTAFDANNLINLGGGNNLNGGGTPCPCDIGVDIGEPGIGMGDDFQTTTFLVMHTSLALTNALFDQQLLGVRLGSVGLPEGNRNGSSKLAGVVPEPSTPFLLGLGLAGVAAATRRSRRSL